MTPEGLLKKKVSSYLDILEEKAHYSMFVPVGYGRRNTLDFTLCFCGQFAAIETKVPGKWLTPLQRQTARSIVQAGGKVFIVSGEEGLNAFKRWAERTLQNFTL